GDAFRGPAGVFGPGIGSGAAHSGRRRRFLRSRITAGGGAHSGDRTAGRAPQSLVPRPELFQVARLTELHSRERWIDTAQQTRQYTAGAHFHESCHAAARQVTNRLDPPHRIGHLLTEPLAGLAAATD